MAANGGVLTINLAVTFSGTFAGNKISYVAARDQLGANSGWQRLGVWSVPPESIVVPRPVTVIPSRVLGKGPLPVAFAVRHASQAGRVVSILINEWLDANLGCYLGFHEPSNTIILYDNGNWLPMALTGNQTVENSFCKVYAQGSSWAAVGLDGQLTLNLELKPAANGNRVVWASAADSTGNSPWWALGTWNSAQASSKIELNLSAVPIDLYQTANSGGLISGCSPSLTIRQCLERMLKIAPSHPNNWRGQGVTGVRFFFTLAGGYYSTPFDASGNITSAWEQNMNLFLADLRSYGITSVTPTPVFDSWSGPPSMMQAHTVETCENGSTVLNFVPWLPYGLDPADNNFPDRSCGNQAYASSPRNPIFWGWERLFNVMNKVLGLAQSNRLDVSSVDYLNETNMVDFTVHARFIYDFNPNGTSTPVLGELRNRMAANGYLATRIIPSANIPPTPVPASFNCPSYYGDSALLINLSALFAAVIGPYSVGIGIPAGHPSVGGLPCGSPGAPVGWEQAMVVLPAWHSWPSSTDIHTQMLFPTGAEIQSYSFNVHSSIWDFVTARGLGANNVVFGETMPVSCDGFSPSAAASFLNGYKASTLFSNAADRVFQRPWHRTETGFACTPSPHVVNPPYDPLTL
jgi:hypothetical protein